VGTGFRPELRQDKESGLMHILSAATAFLLALLLILAGITRVNAWLSVVLPR
jgi:hypothetical protein